MELKNLSRKKQSQETGKNQDYINGKTCFGSDNITFHYICCITFTIDTEKQKL